jgi:hypothetical protein
MTEPDAIVRIPLTQGKWAIVDAIDAPRVLPFRWHAHRRGKVFYAARAIGRAKCYMHAFLCGVSSVDHRDGDGLNNRRSNLRPCTDSQNQANAPIRSDNTSGFKGVSFTRGKWRAFIRFHKKRFFLGCFESPQAAAAAYDQAAQRLFGEFAATNARIAKTDHF